MSRMIRVESSGRSFAPTFGADTLMQTLTAQYREVLATIANLASEANATSADHLHSGTTGASHPLGALETAIERARELSDEIYGSWLDYCCDDCAEQRGIAPVREF